MTSILVGEIIDIAKKELARIKDKTMHNFLDSVTGENIGQIICYRKEKKYNNVLLFVHGFSGNSAQTFGCLPEMLVENEKFKGWDVYSIGYSSDIFPSIGKGLWSVNPDIKKVSLYLNTLIRNLFNEYQRISFVAHSMGGLAVQRLLLDMPKEGQQQVGHVLLFGTPSAGLKKAAWVKFWNKQLNDLSYDSQFITTLRNDWNVNFRRELSFVFKTIAGSKDEFVPIESSLKPFDESYHGVIEGNHINMIKPKNNGDKQNGCYVIIVNTLSNENINHLDGNAEDVNILMGNYNSVIKKYLPKATAITVPNLIQLVFALECTGKNDQARDILLKHLSANDNSDTLGLIGGRYKRKYILEGLQEDFDKGFNYYRRALDLAIHQNSSKQVFYHAINLAFFSVLSGKELEMKRYAQMALNHCISEKKDLWELATMAEAYLYLGKLESSEEYYKEAAKVAGTDVRAKQSIYSNAFLGYQSLMSTMDRNAQFLKMLDGALL
jgi:pimeloyl-ACP methyl ester carboxylesterase